MGWAIALHGGAGAIPYDMPASRKQRAQDALQECLQVGVTALQSSRSALDVVELVVQELENNPVFNAGKGSVLTDAGTVEMEACIMDGVTRKCGAVSGLSTVVNPISLARLVMEKTPHVYLAFEGAEKFAKEQGVKREDMSYFITEENKERLEKAKAANLVQLDYTEPAKGVHLPHEVENGELEGIGHESETVVKEYLEPMGNGHVGETVGCVVVDSNGNCAAATSTGGLVNKMVGRIGDTPLVGAGTYANNSCAVSATGRGEYIIRDTVARDVASLMEYKGVSVAQAVQELMEKRLTKSTTGLIAVSSTGSIVMDFNTKGMFRACADESGYSEIGIWH
eukprot:c13884_g1_i1 orf=377-1393(+)